MDDFCVLLRGITFSLQTFTSSHSTPFFPDHSLLKGCFFTKKRDERDEYIDPPKVNKLIFLCPSFDLQSTLLQEKSNVIKIRNVKIILQIHSDMIWINDSQWCGTAHGGY